MSSSEPDASGETVSQSGAAALPADVDGGGWVTAAPPKALEIVLAVLTFPKLVMRHRDLVTTSVRRELSARFHGTLLGWAWPLVTPLLMFAIYYFIFSMLLSVKFPELPEDQQAAMGIFCFVGILIWSAYAETVVRCTGVIVDNGNLIKKVAFPTEILPLNQVLVNLITMLFGVAVFVVATWGAKLFGLHLWIPPALLTMLVWLPVLLLVQALFTYGLGLLLGTLQVYLRDTLQVVPVAMTIWMFATPIFWTPEIIENWDPAFDPILDLNPMFHLVYAWRVVLMSSEPGLVFTHGDAASAVGFFAVWAVAAFVVGYTFFLMARRRFADEI